MAKEHLLAALRLATSIRLKPSRQDLLLSLVLVSLLTAVAVAFFNPGSLAFRAFDVTESYSR